MKFLLHLKSWQLFLLIFLLAIIPGFNITAQIFNLLGYIIYIAWMYSIGTIMHKMIPDNKKPSVTYFKISCIVFIVFAVFPIFYNPLMNDNIYKFYSNYYLWVLFAYMMWSMLYIFSFAARMLESMIEGEIVGFSDSIKCFFCFWIFPFGLWYIQPAVKRVLDKYNTDESSNSPTIID